MPARRYVSAMSGSGVSVIFEWSPKVIVSDFHCPVVPLAAPSARRRARGRGNRAVRRAAAEDRCPLYLLTVRSLYITDVAVAGHAIIPTCPRPTKALCQLFYETDPIWRR